MYSSVASVRAALTPGSLPEDGSTASGLQDEQIRDAINEADAVIDSHIGSVYTVPVAYDESPLDTVAVAPVRFWSRNIAAYLATLTFKRNKDVGKDEPVRLRYDGTMALLVAIRDGKATVPSLPIPGDEDGDGAQVFQLYDGELFTEADQGLGPEGYMNYNGTSGYYG